MPVWNNVAALCGDDAGSDGRLQSERAAHCKYPIPYLHAVRISQLGGRKGFIQIDFYYCEIRLLIGANHFGVMQSSRRIILQLHPDAIGLLNHVAIGDDETFGINNHARTQ